MLPCTKVKGKWQINEIPVYFQKKNGRKGGITNEIEWLQDYEL